MQLLLIESFFFAGKTWKFWQQRSNPQTTTQIFSVTWASLKYTIFCAVTSCEKTLWTFWNNDIIFEFVRALVKGKLSYTILRVSLDALSAWDIPLPPDKYYKCVNFTFSMTPQYPREQVSGPVDWETLP